MESLKKRNQSKQCPVCSKLGEFKCGNCGSVGYCGMAHQKQHWEEHKAICSGCAKLKKKGRKNSVFNLTTKEIVDAEDGSNSITTRSASLFYTCKYPNGVVIDSIPQESQAPLCLKPGKNFVLPGLLTCLEHMEPGEIAEFIVPPEAAFANKTRWRRESYNKGVDINTPLMLKVTLLH